MPSLFSLFQAHFFIHLPSACLNIDNMLYSSMATGKMRKLVAIVVLSVEDKPLCLSFYGGCTADNFCGSFRDTFYED